MTKIFKTPFAAQGDRVAIPNEVQADGAVSYTQGYGYDYERDQNTDPAAKDIEREKMNGIFHDITEAVGEIQTFGAAQWSIEALPYPLRAQVYYKQKLWQSRIENNKEEPATGNGWLELKADLTASDVGAYNKEEANQRFQPLGNYTPAGYSYGKEESDNRFQPKGNYQPAGNYTLKGESYTKPESDAKYQQMGNYQLAGDYATNSALSSGLGQKLDKSIVAQATGGSTTAIMSQNAVTQALKNAVNIDTIYPVGVVIWFAQNKNPNNLFPETKWAYIGENKTIRLAAPSDSDVLSTGGSDSMTLTVAQMPPHSHSFSANTSSFDYGARSATTSTAGGHNHQLWSDRTWETLGSPVGLSHNNSYLGVTGATHGDAPPGYLLNTGSNRQLISDSGNHNHTISIGIGAHSHSVNGNTSNAGSGSSINITNSYIKLMGWYRLS
ncbi:phage tail protein [Xenorhabdus sp. PB30.3]|uniref:phage baseplate protein n=1 Tax=Xenorhabdus sp. PB30.3 TaxID=2788941 RepID=UPI001E626555|nr:phage tail protein [Xenorhabdus sp. PB30.3]MCC8381101.1 phage tail protein [Xenorhabdus sp. PB30.3]